MVDTLKSRFLAYYQRHEALVSISVFVLGFLFDIFTLGKIDDLLNLIQEAVYLMILGTFLITEIKIKTGNLVLGTKAQKFWEYHDLIVHFLFGSLLSAYTIFYYTSASALTSFLFIMLLAGFMLANEFPQIQKVGLPIRVILFSICVLSYFAFLYPILMGHVGVIPFWLGFVSSFVFFAIVWKLNFKDGANQGILKKHVLLPAVGVHLVFLLGYYFSLIPPVPVAVKRIGVYYEVEKRDGLYIGKHLRPFWKVWQNGSQTFHTRPGDKVTILLSIYSPARFEDKIYLKWWFDDPKAGWTLQDPIPLTILGGREGGLRGFGSKQFYSLGDWEVLIETSDGRQVGNINLTIEEDPSTEPRAFLDDVF